tara:strand:+ start:8761 stop:9150 length:390 start_codon:yes stop_codon:yes gene_type:complete
VVTGPFAAALWTKFSCEAFQEQISGKNQQRVQAISLGSGSDVVSGVLILPFGLLLTKGALLQIDDKLTSAVNGGPVVSGDHIKKPLTRSDISASATDSFRRGLPHKQPVRKPPHTGRSGIAPLRLCGPE